MHTISQVTPNLRSKLEPLFASHQRVDLGISSILEGQSGKQIRVVVDSLENPEIALLRYSVFGILGGNAGHPKAKELVQLINLPCAIQPSPQPWIDEVQQIYAGRVKQIERFSFTHQHIDTGHLEKIIISHPDGASLQKIDLAMAKEMELHDWNQYHLNNYNSAEEFVQLNAARAVIKNGVVASACSAALRCSEGIELNIITLPEYRKQGLAAVVAAAVILNTLTKSLVPHWDAANQSSARLAMRLGYRPAGSYITNFIQ